MSRQHRHSVNSLTSKRNKTRPPPLQQLPPTRPPPRLSTGFAISCPSSPIPANLSPRLHVVPPRPSSPIENPGLHGENEKAGLFLSVCIHAGLSPLPPPPPAHPPLSLSLSLPFFFFFFKALEAWRRLASEGRNVKSQHRQGERRRSGRTLSTRKRL